MRAHGPTAGEAATLFLAAVLIVAVAEAGCGGSPSDPAAIGAAATITITSSGVSPKEVRVPFDSIVLFVNSDSRPHAVSSDPVNTHSDCPAINEVGTLPAGQRRTTGRLQNLRTCGFHDHNNESDTALMGRIIVQ